MLWEKKIWTSVKKSSIHNDIGFGSEDNIGELSFLNSVMDKLIETLDIESILRSHGITKKWLSMLNENYEKPLIKR